jgi:hypothetical protein
MELTLKERMEGVALALERLELKHWGKPGGNEVAYHKAAKYIREALDADARERRAGYGDKPVSKLCPVMSRVRAGQSCERAKCALWMGGECAVVSMARGMGRQGIDVRITPPAVPGL